MQQNRAQVLNLNVMSISTHKKKIQYDSTEK